MKPLILFEFVIGLILFCERTLSRYRIASSCQNLLVLIFKDSVFSDAKADPADDDPGYIPGPGIHGLPGSLGLPGPTFQSVDP